VPSKMVREREIDKTRSDFVGEWERIHGAGSGRKQFGAGCGLPARGGLGSTHLGDWDGQVRHSEDLSSHWR